MTGLPDRIRAAMRKIAPLVGEHEAYDMVWEKLEAELGAAIAAEAPAASPRERALRFMREAA